MDFEISALIGMNLADLKSLVSVGEVPPDPTESGRKRNVPSVEKGLTTHSSSSTGKPNITFF